MRYRNLVITVVFLVAVLSATGQAQSFLPNEPLRLSVDYARFRGFDDNTVNVEIYYSFPERSLTYKADTSGFVGMMDLMVIVKLQDSAVAADRWLVPHTIRDTSNVQKGMNLVGVHKVPLAAGSYHLLIVGRDRFGAARSDSLVMNMPVRLPGTSKVALSDIEFATAVRQEAEPGMFFKNTLEVIPSATGLFGEDQPCFLYAEAYNLLAGGERSNFILRLAVYDAVNKEVISREKTRERKLESNVIVDNIAVHKMRSGTYTAVMAILDTTKKVLVASAKKFFVYNSRLGVDSSIMSAGRGLPLGIYMSMEEPELDREFRWLRYEAVDAEKNQYDKLKGVDSKRKFLSDFWGRRSAERREEYLKRVTQVNTSFNVLGREGYRTDRGRVYIVYGPPDDFDRHPNEPDMRPYEIWNYNNIQGGVIFVFVQRTSGGDYELVHSTHRNELHDENWDRVGITR